MKKITVNDLLLHYIANVHVYMDGRSLPTYTNIKKTKVLIFLLPRANIIILLVS